MRLSGNKAYSIRLLTLIFSGIGTFYSYYLFGIINIHYFTNQSNLLVFLVMLVSFTSYKDKRWLALLRSIALLDIVLTGLIYNTLLIQYTGSFNLEEQVIMFITHTIVPVLYIVYYYFVVEDKPLIKQFYLTLIHPLIYFIIFSLIGLFTGYYVYPFMDASILGWGRMLLFTLGILMPLVILLALLLIYLKQKIKSKR